MVRIGKVHWRRERERGHNIYILCVEIRKVRIELAGVQWNHGGRDGGWCIDQIGYTVALEDDWHSVDGRTYKTATEAMNNAEKLLRQILKKVRGD